MKITNKDVIQSYIVTTARYDFNVYEKRILYRLVELCQAQIKGQKLNDRFSINPDLWGNRDVKIPISYLLKDKEDKNYTRIKNAVERLNEKKFEYEDARQWKIIRLVELPKINKYSEFVEFKIHPEIYHAILDFSKGFRKYELTTAMEFKSTYSMRFYELFSGKKEPITYSIDHLKIMFKIENKYALLADFVKRVINSAQKELNEKSPYSFEYKLEKTGRKVTHIKFYPVYIAENRDPNVEHQELKKQISVRWSLDRMVVDYLKQNFMFDTKEIKNNIDLLTEANKKIDLLYFLSEVRISAEKTNAKNLQGYAINAIKRKLIEEQTKNKRIIS